MSTLLLRLASPLQAWGLDSKFERRGTMREPTKSGVIGILAAALGIERDQEDELKQLSNLKYGVRIDQPGQLLRDYHIAKAIKKSKEDTYVTERYYLADAIFLAGMEGPDKFLAELDEAVNAPIFPLYLGRRSCPPVGRVSLGLRDSTLEDALYNEPWQASPWYKRRFQENIRLSVVMDSKQPGMLRRRDIPLSFSQKHRKYNFRYINDCVNAVFVNNNIEHEGVETDHDPMSGLGG